MPSSKELRERLRVARSRLREAEDSLLAERAREQELRRAYGETKQVRDSAIPPYLRDRN